MQLRFFYINFLKFFAFHFRRLGYFQTSLGFLSFLSFDIRNFSRVDSFYFSSVVSYFLEYKKVPFSVLVDVWQCSEYALVLNLSWFWMFWICQVTEYAYSSKCPRFLSTSSQNIRKCFFLKYKKTSFPKI